MMACYSSISIFLIYNFGMICRHYEKEIIMSHWKIAAAQCEPLHPQLPSMSHITCNSFRQPPNANVELLVFPSLSLLGCVDEHDALPAPPDESL